MSNKRIAVVGTGANGASIAADLVRAGLDVTFIEQWPEHVDAMRSDGIRVDMPNGSLTTSVRAFHVCEVATLRERFDVVLIVVKAYDTRWACELIKPLVRDDGLVIGMQNGMTIDAVASIMGPHRTLGAVIEIAANMFEPGTVERQTEPARTWFSVGAYDSATEGREEEVARLLRHSGTVVIADDIRSAKWMKLVANSAQVLPSAILNLSLLDALDLPGVRETMETAGLEALRAGLALGYHMVPMFGMAVANIDPETFVRHLCDVVASRFASPNTKSAVLHDWMKGRRGEVDDINGVVVAEQERMGGRAPVNRRLVDIAHRIENGDLKPDPSNVDLLVSNTASGVAPART